MNCRDPRGQWCMEMNDLSEELYVTSDLKFNLILINKLLVQQRLGLHDTKAFNVYGAYYLGEQVNSIIRPQSSQNTQFTA